MSDQSFTEYFRTVNTKQFEELVGIYTSIDEWCKKNFPECDFRFEFNSDNVNKKISVKTTILTSNELDSNNRLFKTTALEITEQMWYNTSLISAILSTLFYAQTQWIARIINDHYKKSKQQRGIE